MEKLTIQENLPWLGLFLKETTVFVVIQVSHHRVLVFRSHEWAEFLRLGFIEQHRQYCPRHIKINFCSSTLMPLSPVSLFLILFFAAGSTFTAKRMRVPLKSRLASTRALKVARLLAGWSWISWTRKLKIPRRRFSSTLKTKSYTGVRSF